MPQPQRVVKLAQREMNAFVKDRLLDVGPLLVDGDVGAATRKRVKLVKWYLGYPRKRVSGALNDEFLWRLHHPNGVRESPKRKWDRRRRRLGRKRRLVQKRDAVRNRLAARKHGVSAFEGGRLVANWMHPHLKWAREHGWQGTVVSGWRDPKYSQSLCYRMCGAPSCPGKCAGLASNHVGSSAPRGAIDVSDYVRFGQLARSCPHQPRIYNALGARDPVHFSATGN